MSQQFVVVRGQIEAGKKVVAKEGASYTPRNKQEEERLLSAGVIAPLTSDDHLIDDEESGDHDETGGDQDSESGVQQDSPEGASTKPAPAKRPRKQ